MSYQTIPNTQIVCTEDYFDTLVATSPDRTLLLENPPDQLFYIKQQNGSVRIFLIFNTRRHILDIPFPAFDKLTEMIKEGATFEEIYLSLNLSYEESS